jgi:2-phosphosulfolactate phosphatase
MEIRLESLLEGANRASGAVAVIDVLRAFTTAAVALSRGATQIVMVGAVDEALALRERGLGAICMGEVGGHAPPGFDYGNSPYELSNADVAGKTIIQRTSAGTQGIVAAARQADSLYAASLVTARATAQALRASALRAGGPRVITLVAMGKAARARTDEDELCAIHLRNLLEGRPGDPDAVRRLVLAGGEIGDLAQPGGHLHPRDVDIALDVDRHDFAIRVRVEDGRPVARLERASA